MVKGLRGAQASKQESPGGVLRLAAKHARQEAPSGSQDAGDVLEGTLRIVLESGAVQGPAADVLRTILDSGMIDDLADHVLPPLQRLVTRAAAAVRCPCLK